MNIHNAYGQKDGMHMKVHNKLPKICTVSELIMQIRVVKSTVIAKQDGIKNEAC
jgi:hypothetical protein